MPGRSACCSHAENGDPNELTVSDPIVGAHSLPDVMRREDTEAEDFCSDCPNFDRQIIDRALASGGSCINPTLCTYEEPCCEGNVCVFKSCVKTGQPKKAEAPTTQPTPTPQPAPTSQPTPTFEPAKTPVMLDLPSVLPSVVGSPINDPYIPGQLTVHQHGFALSSGLSVRIVAESGKRFEYENGTTSDLPFHFKPDAATVFEDDRPTNPGGWIYVSNSEVVLQGGGVGSLVFDKEGNPIDYMLVLNGTSRNCGGGKTPYGTWISCEENGDDGQIWEVSPLGDFKARKTVLGTSGGNFESVACDNRDPSNVRFFITNDSDNGEIRRFRPSSFLISKGKYHKYFMKGGKMEYLVLKPRLKRFSWTNKKWKGKLSASLYFRNVEGIDFDKGMLFFVSKEQRELFTLDLDAGTFNSTSTSGGMFNKPDQVVSVLSESGEEDDVILYFTEDGRRHPGIHGRDRKGNFVVIVEAEDVFFEGDESTGVAFSPDNRRLYFALQKAGLLYELTRNDGLPFHGKNMLLKAHPKREHIGDSDDS